MSAACVVIGTVAVLLLLAIVTTPRFMTAYKEGFVVYVVHRPGWCRWCPYRMMHRRYLWD